MGHQDRCLSRQLWLGRFGYVHAPLHDETEERKDGKLFLVLHLPQPVRKLIFEPQVSMLTFVISPWKYIRGRCFSNFVAVSISYRTVRYHIKNIRNGAPSQGRFYKTAMVSSVQTYTGKSWGHNASNELRFDSETSSAMTFLLSQISQAPRHG